MKIYCPVCLAKMEWHESSWQCPVCGHQESMSRADWTGPIGIATQTSTEDV